MAHSEKTLYPRIGEEVIRTTLDNGLPVFIVPKKDYRRKYAMFATRYGGMDMALSAERPVAGHPCRHRPLSGA